LQQRYFYNQGVYPIDQYLCSWWWRMMCVAVIPNHTSYITLSHNTDHMERDCFSHMNESIKYCRVLMHLFSMCHAFGFLSISLFTSKSWTTTFLIWRATIWILPPSCPAAYTHFLFTTNSILRIRSTAIFITRATCDRIITFTTSCIGCTANCTHVRWYTTAWAIRCTALSIQSRTNTTSMRLRTTLWTGPNSSTTIPTAILIYFAGWSIATLFCSGVDTGSYGTTSGFTPFRIRCCVAVFCCSVCTRKCLLKDIGLGKFWRGYDAFITGWCKKKDNYKYQENSVAKGHHP